MVPPVLNVFKAQNDKLIWLDLCLDHLTSGGSIQPEILCDHSKHFEDLFPLLKWVFEQNLWKANYF